MVMDSDAWDFGGFNRLAPAKNIFYPVKHEKWQNRENYVQVYIPNRTAIVLCAEENLAKYKLNIGGRGYTAPTTTEESKE
jgi:1,4-alpha-glucan branching enzyme